ncbi:MAG: heavy metal-binding domain-containing protein [Thermodesulfobacteriota bacterium]|nr:heavy metal-binding domain-containing protein [Thermodesulfobacteriota bacterium]
MFDIIIFLALVAMGYFIGSFSERRHFHSLEKREADKLLQPIVTMEDVAYPEDQIQSATLVSGSAVISVDYFKRLLAGLRNIFGGTIKSYESLLDRARREALLRMREAAPGAGVIVNVRIETASIGRRANKKGVGCVEAIAYGTALTLRK